jgi:hypothetical protein
MIQGFQRSSRGKTAAARRPSTSSQWRALRFIVLGEVAFLVFTGVCVVLHPGFVVKRNEGGLSDYGVHLKTVIPYTLALGLLGTYSLRAAVLYSKNDRRSRRLRSLIFSYCSVVLLVLLSTYVYTLNKGLKDFHYALGTLLIVVVFVGSLWMYRLWPASATVRVFLFVQLAGDVLNIMTAFGKLHVLFVAELVSNVGFALILGRTARRIALEDGNTQQLESSAQ